MLFREALEREQDKAVERIVEVGVDVEADEFRPEVEILLYQDGHAVSSFGYCGEEFVKGVYGFNSAEQRGRIDSKIVRPECVRG